MKYVQLRVADSVRALADAVLPSFDNDRVAGLERDLGFRMADKAVRVPGNRFLDGTR